jgi:hypothetical protein
MHEEIRKKKCKGGNNSLYDGISLTLGGAKVVAIQSDWN